MICALWLAIVLSAVYGWLLCKQIRFVHNARETTDSPIPEDSDGTIILVLSYLSMFTLAMNLILVLCAKRRAVVLNTHFQ